MGDRNCIQSRFGELRRAMMDDGIQLGLSYHDKDLQTILSRGKSEGTSFFWVTLPLLGKALDQALVNGTLNVPTNFALKPRTRLPKFCHGVFRDIFQDDGILRAEPNLRAIQHLRQFLLFDSKLIREPSVEQRKESIKKFSERMQANRKARIPYDHFVLREARNLLTFVLSDLDLSDINPGHGPGIVSDGLDHFERWDFTKWSKKAERYYPYLLYGISSLPNALRQGRGIPLFREGVTKVCLVPKDFRGPRLISAEPTVHQYLQQGQMKKMMQYIRSHWLIGKSVRLNDQTFNRRLASKSFENGSATLDLSDASDTVSVPLVWYLFGGVPRLRRQLMCTRSDIALYEGRERIRITAFAPMGSAVCFPVETLVFWSLAMASLRLHRIHAEHRRKTIFWSWRECASSIAVFGDDIVIPIDALGTLTEILSASGLKPNMSKTCYLTPFRESCGGEWFNGIPVSIYRNRRYHYEVSKKIAHYPVLLDLQRKFFSKGYFKTAETLLRWARKIWPVYSRSFEPKEDASLQEDVSASRFCCAYASTGSFDPALRTRFNRDLQRHEVRIPSPYQSMTEWGTGGYARLLARLLQDQVDRLPNRDSNVRIGWHYLPAFRGVESLKEA